MTLVLLNIIRLPDGRYSGSEVNLSSETSPWRYNNSLDWSRTDNGELCNAFVRQRVVEFADSDMSGVFFHDGFSFIISAAKVRIFGKI